LGFETTLGQTALQRHLTAFKADLVITARTRFLALVTTTGSFAQTRTNTATDATFGVFGTRGVLDVIEFHHLPLREL
jgi:hypothetical protein